VNWDVVVNTDARPHEGDWDKLQLLVGRALTVVERRIAESQKPVLLVYANLLARYGRMDLLEKLRDRVGRPDGIPGLWLLIPGDHQAPMDGKAVPVPGPGQRVRIPESWLKNKHRSNGKAGVSA
jgi:hypothetical protein